MDLETRIARRPRNVYAIPVEGGGAIVDEHYSWPLFDVRLPIRHTGSCELG